MPRIDGRCADTPDRGYIAIAFLLDAPDLRLELGQRIDSGLAGGQLERRVDCILQAKAAASA